MREPQNAALFLGERRPVRSHRGQQPAENDQGSETSVHAYVSPSLLRVTRRGYLSSQMSSMRQPLEMLLTMIVSPLT